MSVGLRDTMSHKPRFWGVRTPSSLKFWAEIGRWGRGGGVFGTSFLDIKKLDPAGVGTNGRKFQSRYDDRIVRCEVLDFEGIGRGWCFFLSAGIFFGCRSYFLVDVKMAIVLVHSGDVVFIKKDMRHHIGQHRQCRAARHCQVKCQQ